VVIRGFNDGEVEGLAQWARERGRELRFIEFMPLEGDRIWDLSAVVPAAEIESATQALARTIADNAPLSLAGIKAVIQRALAPRETIAADDLDAAARRARASADASEGRRAMLEKRKPSFRGE